MRLIDADREIERYSRDFLCPTPDVHEFEKRNAIVIVNALRQMPTAEKGGITMTHQIKLRQEFAEAVASGDKPFEIRYNDRGYQKGDLIKFEIVDSMDVHCYHEIENKLYEITYVIGGWGLQEGYVVFGIKERKRKEKP